MGGIGNNDDVVFKRDPLKVIIRDIFNTVLTGIGIAIGIAILMW